MSPVDVDHLSLRQKVGQLFVVGFEGTEPSAAVGRLIEDHGLGGVIYFSRNLSTPAQTRSLSERLQERATAAGLPPLLVAIDQEGGPVSRFSWGGDLPSAMALGATHDPDLAFEVGKTVGERLRSLGINLDLAPVLDVNDNPDNPVIGVRSIGESPDLVGRLGTRIATGLQATDVLACGKHFPGHGDTDADSHHELPVVPHERDRLDQIELHPFRRAVEDGIDAIMTTHVAFPAITGDERPATVARSVVTGLLREEFSYDGLVVTDCLEMNAIAEGIGTAEAAVWAVDAGCDILTVSHTPDTQLAAMQAVLAAVKEGRLSEARLDESVSRILDAKRRRALERASSPDWEATVERSQTVAARVARNALTLVRDRTGSLPIQGPVTVVPGSRWASVPGPAYGFDADAVVDAIESAACPASRLPVEGDTTALLEYAAVVDPEETVVVATLDAVGDEAQVRVVRAFSERVDNLIVVSLASPYDLRRFPEVDCYLASYDHTPASLSAVGAVLRGELEVQGTLPVTIPGTDW